MKITHTHTKMRWIHSVTGKSNLFHFIFKMTITYRNICVYCARERPQASGGAGGRVRSEGRRKAVCHDVDDTTTPTVRHIDDDDEEDINAEHVFCWKYVKYIRLRWRGFRQRNILVAWHFACVANATVDHSKFCVFLFCCA